MVIEWFSRRVSEYVDQEHSEPLEQKPYQLFALGWLLYFLLVYG
jgi:hypothetical protein